MNDYFSDKLKLVSLIAIIIVFYIHADFPEQVYQTMTVPVIVRKCIAGVFGPCANPLFFAISGYLFFFNVKDMGEVFYKMRKRVKSLLIPFLIAAPVFPLFFVLVEQIPGASTYISNLLFADKFRTMPVSEIIVSLFYDAGDGYPWAFHLWFLRDLITIVLIAPVIYFFRRFLSYVGIVVVLILSYNFPNVLFLYPLYWFLFGSFFLYKLNKLSKWSIYSLLLIFACMVVYRQICLGTEMSYIYNITERTIGVVALWCLYDQIIPNHFRLQNYRWLASVCSFTFFLYVYHEPFFNILVRIIPMIAGVNQFGYTLSYLISPPIFAVIMIIVGSFMRKYIPKFYTVIAGGR